ncbi:CBS and ACT domain-containing protein [Desulfobacca acetoxidans]|uniref:CBS domain containing membrane protein n=1 Tax=Desulfobacca acetoxidans (strain ATCC 700848 / DSM 11109 / ASRB2) TaxID=880072 RepID=F2NEI1_DESAR|nr:CBS and ACT domain-containing protein [Desulfobacca acetoxidans]AEB08171.1 CBS domain containing membrane protein [Desulfobacca acetoxidans DSM 11109]
MLIREWMATDVLTVDENTSMMKALHLMKENKIRRLPVMSHGKLVGIISDRDLKEASPSKATTLDVHELYYLLAEIKIKEIMTKNPITIQPDETIERAAVVMLENKVSGLPVVNGKSELVGIVTQSDIFRAFVNITGIYRGGVQFAFSLDDRPGSIKEVADTVREHGGRIVSILSSTDMAVEGTRNVYIRIRNLPQEDLENLEKTLRQKFRVIYMVKDILKTV